MNGATPRASNIYGIQKAAKEQMCALEDQKSALAIGYRLLVIRQWLFSRRCAILVAHKDHYGAS
jgi:hypothetical protein